MYKMILYATLPAVALAFSLMAGASTPQYTIEAQIKPEEGAATYSVVTPVPGPADAVTFLLHGDLSLGGIEGDRIATEEVTALDTIMGLSPAHALSITLTFEPPIEEGESTDVAWTYSGWIRTSRIQLGPGGSSAEWFEHDVGSLWIPTVAELDQQFTYTLDVDAPEQYRVYGAGEARPLGDRFRFRTSAPGLSASLALAREDTVKELAFPGGKLVAPLDAPDLELLGERMAESAALFERLLGGTHSQAEVTVVLPPAARARPEEAYARDRYFVLSHGLKPGPERIGIAAHELAHAWWSHALPQSRHNFLNESFAEYFAWLALAEVFGSDTFARSLAEAESLGEGAGSINDWTPRGNFSLVYGKGPLLLHELRVRLGDEAFFKLMRQTYQARLDRIPAFLRMIEQISDAATAQWFEARL